MVESCFQALIGMFPCCLEVVHLHHLLVSSAIWVSPYKSFIMAEVTLDVLSGNDLLNDIDHGLYMIC